MTQKSLFWIEAIEKEDRKRIAWFVKNKEALEENNQKEPRQKVDEMVAVGNEKFFGGYDNRYNLTSYAMALADVKRKLTWFERYYDLMFGHLPREEVPKNARALWEEIKKRRAETMQSTPRHTRPHPAVSLPPRDLTVMMDPMRPVPPEIHDLIYQGISHEDEGRKKYLVTRYKDYPEDKFYLADCTSWLYGWNIKDVELHKLYRVPRIQIIQSSFYRRGGVERDPDHYRDAVNVEAPMFFPQL